MNYELRIIAFLFPVGSIMFFSCVKELPFDTKESEVPVVNCLLTNDSVQELSLTQSVKITDPYYFKEIKDAEISLFADSVPVGYFERKSYGTWQLNYTPVEGAKYQLLVKLPDGRELKASTTMPAADSFYPLINKDRYPTRNFTQFTADFPCWIYCIYDDEMPQDYMHLSPSYKSSLNNELGTNHPWIDGFNRHDNMSDITLPATMPFYDYYLRIQSFPDTILEGISFGIQTNYSYYAYVYFRTASEEYDRYLKSSIQKMNNYRDESDPGQMFDETRVYSNIENGSGIFGAYNEHLIFYNLNNFVLFDGKILFYDKDTPPFFQY